MSAVGAITEVPRAIIKPLMNPKTLLIGAGITAGSLFILSAILPGIGQWVGLRTMPLLPRLHPSLGIWPFVPMAMNGDRNSAQIVPGSFPGSPPFVPVPTNEQDYGSRAISDALGYANAMLQVT